MSEDQLSSAAGGPAEVAQSRGGDSVLVILPTFNEVATLGEVVPRLNQAVSEAHILVVDDASSDGTGELANELSANSSNIFVLHRGAKLGLGTAYLAAFEWAKARGYRWLVEMDADGSHLPEQLPDLLRAARNGAGLVIGARWIDGGRVLGWPWYRRWISRTGTGVARLLLHSRLHDITSGFRVIDQNWLSMLPEGTPNTQGYGFQVELAWGLEEAGCPIAEVPITFVERRAGKSKMTVGIAYEALALVLRQGLRLRLAPRKPSGPPE